ncbi:TonB family protein, partial [Brevundimonas sp.]|uniref:TonB family protein n=1 Tax=Brevundimonas sp. TaxID=1871086 RepID=UPI002B6AB783
VPNAPPPPVTLPIEPVKKEDRVEYTGPPVIVPGPPPPPAPPAPPRPSVITNPSWARQVAGEFPERALSRGIESGTVRVSCAVQPNGSLTDCQVRSEDPAGAGFGQAALAAARRSRVSPRTVDGAAVGARVEWTQRYRAAD